MSEFNVGDLVEAFWDGDRQLGYTTPFLGRIKAFDKTTGEYRIDNGAMIAFYKAEHMRKVGVEL